VSSEALLDQLIEALRCLPGVGPKSAQRMALHLLERDRDGGVRLSAILAAAMERIGRCRQCRNLTEQELCRICANPQRDASRLCIVESPSDVLAIEHATGYQGRYFVLMGRLSPLDGVGPAELGLDELAQRLADAPPPPTTCSGWPRSTASR
jgi:recombination protein RecR